MKHIKRLRLFESTQELDQEQIDFLNGYTTGEWKINPNTGLVDIMGNFNCSFRFKTSFELVKFGVVHGSFDCSNNSLDSLEGAPQKVVWNFHCGQNYLTSLKGAPKEVVGYFYSGSNSLTSLEGSPEKIEGGFDCSNNSLDSLEGAPEEVGKGFYCNRNSLTSLGGAPEKIGGGFDCSNNSLTSLEGAPKKVGRWFDCSNNSLTSLEGAPEKVVGDFICDTFELGGGEWNPQGWLKILIEGNKKAKKLILTLPYFEPENLQNEINKNPGKWVMELKGVWNSEEFRPLRDQLKVSDRFIKDIGDQSALSDLGF